MKTTSREIHPGSSNFFKPLRQIALIAAVVACVAGVRAQTVLTNLDETMSSVVGVDRYNWYGTLFRTGDSASSYELQEVTLAMGSGNSLGGNFFVAIYSNNVFGGTNYVGALSETLAGDAAPEAAGNHTYVSSGLILQADTLYWLVAGVSTAPQEPGLGYSWQRTDSATYLGTWERNMPVGPAGLSDPTNVALYNTLDWAFTGGGYLQYSLTATGATAVPEPSTWAVWAGGLGLVVVLGQRWRGKQWRIPTEVA